jgi:hypothetical protein
MVNNKADHSENRTALLRLPNFFNQRVRPQELFEDAPEAASWLWYGYLGAGKITLLTSQWKLGKTTLIGVLLARMAHGGQLAGLPVAAGRAAVVSEESAVDWTARCRKLRMGNHLSLFCRPFRSKPTMVQWRGLIDAMLDLHRREDLDLVVIDPLTVFLPGHCENTASGIVECLGPLRDLTDRGLSVLLLHHPRKGINLAGQAARGSGALASYVDIVIEMSWYGQPDDDDRRRWLRGYSRYEETRRHLVVEWTPAGDDYLANDAVHDQAWAENWAVLRLVLEDATARLTQREILEQWPEDFRKPDRVTISRGLRRGVDQGLIRKQGSGRKNDPFRYWLPGKEDDFFPGMDASAEELRRWSLRTQSKWLKSLGIDPSVARESTPASTGKGRGRRPAATMVDTTTTGAISEPAITHALVGSAVPAVTESPPPAAAPAAAEVPPTAVSGPVAAPVPILPPAPATSPAPASPSAPKQPRPEDLAAAERRRLRRWPC